MQRTQLDLCANVPKNIRHPQWHDAIWGPRTRRWPSCYVSLQVNQSPLTNIQRGRCGPRSRRASKAESTAGLPQSRINECRVMDHCSTLADGYVNRREPSSEYIAVSGAVQTEVAFTLTTKRHGEF